MKRKLFLMAALIILVLAFTSCSEGQTYEESVSGMNSEENTIRTVSDFGCSYIVPENWENWGWEDTDYYPFEYDINGEEYVDSIEVSVYYELEDIVWESYCEELISEDGGVSSYKALEINDVEVLYLEDYKEETGYIHAYYYNVDNKGYISICYYSAEANPAYMNDFERLANSMDVSGVSKYIDEQREEILDWMEEKNDSSGEEDKENSSTANQDDVPEEELINNEALEEKYIETIRDIFENNIDIYGREISPYGYRYDEKMNQFSIYDIDQDGALELIISWKNCSMSEMWGGVYQYDFESNSYTEELRDEDIMFFENGAATIDASHNHSRGEMWPFAVYMYSPEQDRYEFIFHAYSWDKMQKEEGFPEEADTDGVGTVYFVDYGFDSGYYENPISQTDFYEITIQYLSGVNVLDYPLYIISEQGIMEYQEDQ